MSINKTKSFPCPICKKLGHKAADCWYKKSAMVCNFCGGDHLVTDCRKFCTRCERAGHSIANCRARPCWTCNSIKFHDWRKCEEKFKNLRKSSVTQPNDTFFHESSFTQPNNLSHTPMNRHSRSSFYGSWSSPQERERRSVPKSTWNQSWDQSTWNQSWDQSNWDQSNWDQSNWDQSNWDPSREREYDESAWHREREYGFAWHQSDWNAERAPPSHNFSQRLPRERKEGASPLKPPKLLKKEGELFKKVNKTGVEGAEPLLSQKLEPSAEPPAERPLPERKRVRETVPNDFSQKLVEGAEPPADKKQKIVEGSEQDICAFLDDDVDVDVMNFGE